MTERGGSTVDHELETAVQHAVDALASSEPVIVTDWVIVVAGVRPSEAGERTGYWYMPRPHQPLHQTLGLLDYAHHWARSDALEDDGDDG